MTLTPSQVRRQLVRDLPQILNSDILYIFTLSLMAGGYQYSENQYPKKPSMISAWLLLAYFRPQFESVLDILHFAYSRQPDSTESCFPFI